MFGELASLTSEKDRLSGAFECLSLFSCLLVLRGYKMEQHTSTPFNPALAYADYKSKLLAFLVASVTAFLASAYFTIGYFAGHLRFYEYGYTEWLNFLVGFGITLALTLFQAFLYARDKGKNGGKAALLATIVAVSFGFLSEVGQGMERDEARMLARSANSGTYQAVINALKQAPQAHSNPYAIPLSNAESRLSQCLEKLSRGLTLHCEGDKARVASLQESAKQAETTASTSSLALVNKSKELERDEKNYHPLVTLARTTLGLPAIVASFLVSLIIVGFFEFAFHHLGQNYAESKSVLLANGYDVSKKAREIPYKLLNQSQVSYPPSKGVSVQEEDSKGSQEALKRKLYFSTKAGMLKGTLSPTLTEVSEWVATFLTSHGLSNPSNNDFIAQKLLDLLVKDGVLVRTPDGYQLAHRQEPVKTDEELQLPVRQVTVKNETSEKSSVYTQNEQAKVGELCHCPQCGKSFQKSNKWHLFCSNNRKPREDGGNCSDEWHNTQRPERLEAKEKRLKSKG